MILYKFRFSSKTSPPLVFLIACMLFHPLYAQEKVGEVNKIKAVDTQSLQEPTKRVRVQQHESAGWQDGYSGLPVQLGDKILINQYTRVYLELADAERKGKLLLSSAKPDGSEHEAAFNIGEEITPIEGLQFTILKGSLVIDWTRGKLTAVAAGIRCLFEGTQAVFIAEEDGQSAVLYLQEGRISYPDFPGFELTGPQTARLIAGQPPMIAAPEASSPEQLDQFADQQTRLWKKPFWQQTGFLILGGAASAGLLYLILSSGNGNGNGNEKHSGTVEIIIP
ncbi:MAG: hypothetical protein WAN36_14790 [Calditrichia bacterium]